jgi:hypothetical protein
MLREATMDKDEKALRPIPKRHFVLAFVAGGVCAAGLSVAAYLAEQRAAPEPEGPAAAATETGGELDPSVRRELERLDREDEGSSWLDE